MKRFWKNLNTLHRLHYEGATSCDDIKEALKRDCVYFSLLQKLVAPRSVMAGGAGGSSLSPAVAPRLGAEAAAHRLLNMAFAVALASGNHFRTGAIIRSQVPCGGAKAAHSSRVFSRHLFRSRAWRAARNRSGCLGPKTRVCCSEKSPNLHIAAATCSTSSFPDLSPAVAPRLGAETTGP